MILTTLALLLATTLTVAAHARELPRSAGAQPFVNQGGCPSGYYLSGSFCTPLNKDSRPAVPRPLGASCPSGWYASGSGCVKLNC
jgi:hypothetical protein